MIIIIDFIYIILSHKLEKVEEIMFQIFIQGFLLQASLILALGAQNLFVIDVGLKKNNHILAATICGVCDVLLILLGILGVSAFLVRTPSFKIIVGIFGALFLIYYSFLKLKEAIKGVKIKEQTEEVTSSRKLIAIASLSFTLLNPHVYIDTFFLVGGYSTRFENLTNKLIFGIGAGSFSLIWFYFLAFFSSKFSHVLTKEKNLRIISLFTGILLSYLGIRLGMDSFQEIATIF